MSTRLISVTGKAARMRDAQKEAEAEIKALRDEKQAAFEVERAKVRMGGKRESRDWPGLDLRAGLQRRVVRPCWFA